MTKHPAAELIWNAFCSRFSIAQKAVPLFATQPDGTVSLKTVGKAVQRPLLMRSPDMETMVRAEVAKLVADHEAGTHRLDGLIYMMGTKQGNTLGPLYIGKTETLGKGDGNLSANIQHLDTDTSKFARWGDNYAYHIGDLSACVLQGHTPSRLVPKYQAWAQTLFTASPTQTPLLRQPVYFWAKAWDNSWVGVWQELGATRLAFLEYLLIGVASMVSPQLLNREGLGRRVGE